ncbi:hypothetical protein Glove_139g368 [Diversispora epigaea]|uniref:Uncharacterized protein n=1 Tax=Diversispora epigaea TaxID=1348612 RepID=A0A397J4E5_9GLOM|nr:hypothetical protein Glove_139g368 [Diversispora epigaea]
MVLEIDILRNILLRSFYGITKDPELANTVEEHRESVGQRTIIFVYWISQIIRTLRNYLARLNYYHGPMLEPFIQICLITNVMRVDLTGFK